MDIARVRFTDRLRLEPITRDHVGDLKEIHSDDAVAAVFTEWTPDNVERNAGRLAGGWESDGIGKWMAYDRVTGDLVGRGGLSRAFVDSEWHLEVGWTVRDRHVGHGFATEIGRAGLACGFDELGAEEIVAFTEVDNRRSRAVMARLDMRYLRDIVHDDAPFALYSIGRRDRV